jgi:dTDP-4-dehydrorhamnose 3,5-epimerase
MAMLTFTPVPELPDVLLIDHPRFPDERGYFTELWHSDKYQAAGIPPMFVQDNLSRSKGGVLRGLHYQWPNPQGKLVVVLEGTIFDVAVDVRRDSPSFGRWFGGELSADVPRQIYIPEGFAHGFCVLSEQATVLYKCTRVYDPAGDAAIAWNDPQVNIAWPLREPLLSAKDRAAPTRAKVDSGRLPTLADLRG